MTTPLGTEVDISAGHIVLDVFPAPRERGTAPPPLLGPCVLWPQSPISATAELLLYNETLQQTFRPYCRSCPKDDKFRYFIPILRKLMAA